jgi:proteasome lid subunit RPN8/RPN11
MSKNNACNEHCWVLLGHRDGDLWWGRMHKMTVGAPCSVAFDSKWVLEREEKKGDVVGFLHTHPGMVGHYSSRDDRTMKAWCLSAGRPLVCCIQGIDAWWYLDDESPPEELSVKQIGKLLFGVTPELYEFDTGSPTAGLELGDPMGDPSFRPIEDFLPEDEKRARQFEDLPEKETK